MKSVCYKEFVFFIVIDGAFAHFAMLIRFISSVSEGRNGGHSFEAFALNEPISRNHKNALKKDNPSKFNNASSRYNTF